jgi:hypothetical protein
MLRTRLKRSDFSLRGELRLKCVASIMGLYHISSGSVAIWLVEGKPPANDTGDTVSTGELTLSKCRISQTQVTFSDSCISQ